MSFSESECVVPGGSGGFDGVDGCEDRIRRGLGSFGSGNGVGGVVAGDEMIRILNKERDCCVMREGERWRDGVGVRWTDRGS